MNNSFILPVATAATLTVRESLLENLVALRQEWESRLQRATACWTSVHLSV